MTGIETETIEVRAAKAKRAWDEAWSNMAASKTNWQRISFGLAACLLLAIWGVIHLGSLPKNVLYVVEKDKLGNVAYAGPVQPQNMNDETWNQIKVNSFKQWIEEWRTVTTDHTAQEHYWDRAFAHVGDNSPAAKKLSIWFENNNPIRRATAGETAEVSYKTFDVEGNNTIGIWWQETTRKAGQIVSDKVWRVRITYAQKVPTRAIAKAENPLGFMAMDFSVEEVQ